MPTLEIPVPVGASPSNIVMLQIADIEPWALNPRKTFDEEALQQLAQSIQAQGVLQNIVVRRLRPENREGEQNFRYEVIAGERRWRASQIAGIDIIPARILSDMTSDADAFELALRENMDRQSLAPLDEAEGYQKMLMLSHTKQEELGDKLGISQSTISNALRLLRLPEPVRAKIREGLLSKAVALVLCKLVDYPADCAEIAFMAAEEGYTQRQVTKLVDTRWHKLESAKRERQASLPLPLEETPPATTTATVEVSDDDSDPDEQPTPAVVPSEKRLQDEDLEDPFGDEEDSNAGDATEAEDTSAEQPEETAETAPAAPASAQSRVDAPVSPAPAPQTVAPTPAPTTPATPTAPTETVTAPAGPMIAASISQATDDWLFEQNLTLDKAISELQTYRLTPVAKQTLQKIYDLYALYLPEGEDAQTISQHLETVLVQYAQSQGLIPKNDD